MSDAKAIDVFEKYQGRIKWAEVYSAGVRNVFVKLTNGASAASPAGDTYVTGAHAAGIAVGAYAYVLGGSATAQADAFAAELLRLDALDLAPAIDFEDTSLPTSATSRRAFITEFFAKLKARIPALDRVLVYSSGSELAAMNAGAITVPGLQVLIWDAEYGPDDGREHPLVHYTGAVAVHQYTSLGSVSGVAGTVDEDTIDTDITEEEDMGALQSNDPTYLDLVGRVEAMSQGLDTVTWAQAPSHGEVSVAGRTVGARIPSVGNQISALAVQVAAIQGALPNWAAQIIAAMPAPGQQMTDEQLATLGEHLGDDVVTALYQRLAPAPQ
jgi:GH25 family lysozyme M1 (1,4-beta-N-acetylmuramidase)